MSMPKSERKSPIQVVAGVRGRVTGEAMTSLNGALLFVQWRWKMLPRIEAR
jgi:hypothetical protein